MRQLIRLIEDLAEAFDRLGLPYAVGGALANNYWGIIRATVDADCLVAVPPPKYQRLVDELTAICNAGPSKCSPRQCNANCRRSSPNTARPRVPLKPPEVGAPAADCSPRWNGPIPTTAKGPDDEHGPVLGSANEYGTTRRGAQGKRTHGPAALAA